MRRLAAALGALALVAVLVVDSGIISVKASSGHLPLTAWVLDVAKRRSVKMRARPIEVPPLDAPALIRLGAAHFERGCRPCHGAPGDPPPVVPSRMTPHPPSLPQQVVRWAPRELFYLVSHGVKFTGMPAWPSPQRTDEVWAMVAFLRRLPVLGPEQYRDLAGPAGAARCAHCHDGRSPLVPRLSGQSPEYLAAAFDAYADGRRFSGIMQPIAAALDRGARATLSRAMAARARDDDDTPGADALPALLVDGDADREIPPCLGCHAPEARARDPRYPALAGQPAAYLRQQLQLFADDRRGGAATAAIMQPIAARLSPSQMDEAARAFAALREPQP